MGLIVTSPRKNSRRLVILGDSYVGKTSIASRFLKNHYDENYYHTVDGFYRKTYTIKGTAYQMDIVDTPGSTCFSAKEKLDIIMGDLFLLVYSIDSCESFAKMTRLYDEIVTTRASAQRSQSLHRRMHGTVPVIVVGNKTDRESHRTVSKEMTNAWVDAHPHLILIEASAKTHCNLSDVFHKLLRRSKLPLEMSPSMHRSVQKEDLAPPLHFSRLRHLLRLGRNDAKGAVDDRACRPNVYSELRYIRYNRRACASQPKTVI